MPSMVKIAKKIDIVGLFQEKSKKRGWGYTFHFTLRNSRERESNLSSLEILRNCVTPFWNFKVKNQDPWKLHDFFLYRPRNFTFLLIDSWKFYIFFLHYPWKFHVLNPCPCLYFFWNSQFWGDLPKNLPKSSLKGQFLLVQKRLKI